MVFSAMPGSMLLGFFGFAFFFGDFGAELDVFFVFDRAAGFFAFAFGFFSAFAFVARFGFFVFFFGGGGEGAGEGGQAQRLRRGRGSEQQGQQEGEEFAHLPFIGRTAGQL